MNIKNIFFDFDGVIAESVSAKTDAFEEMYLPYGKDIAAKVVEYHKLNGGVSRYEKFKYFHKEFLNEVIDQKKINELAIQFSNIVLDKVINSLEVPGSHYFIEKYHKKFQFWIITGTPTDEMEIIANKRGLVNYFLGIHGSPNNKRYWTENLIKKHNLKRDEIIFLGDATTDMDAANFSKTHFALRENQENKEIFNSYKGIRFQDFYELEKILKLN
ncbi:HAD hydrolase-like protein [Polaribacter sp.]|uniref:HAD family hydrolase n=1 Tax=Polaribacter sp. TaxID=1920175 RepID=UPI0025DF1E91|nr:HAD hydrolase-like protein [Polaribacter sp.]